MAMVSCRIRRVDDALMRAVLQRYGRQRQPDVDEREYARRLHECGLAPLCVFRAGRPNSFPWPTWNPSDDCAHHGRINKWALWTVAHAGPPDIGAPRQTL